MPLPSFFQGLTRSQFFPLAIVLVVVLGSASAALLLARAYISSNGDLVRIDARAHAVGLPATWPEAGLVVADADRLGVWKAVVKLAKRLPPWTEEPGERTLLTGLPLPSALAAHHAHLDPAALEELLGQIDRLGDAPLVQHGELRPETTLPEIEVYRSLANLLAQRVILAQQDQLGRECHRLLGFLATCPAQGIVLHLVRNSLYGVALGAMTRRLGDLKTMAERDVWAVEVLALADLLVQGERQMLGAEYLTMRACFGDLRTVDLASLGEGGPRKNSWIAHLWEGYVLRSGSEAGFGVLLDFAGFLDTRPATPAVMAESRRVQVAYTGKTPGNIVAHVVTGGALTACRKISALSILRAKLLVAEATGGAWPEDDFDPQHLPLRRIESAGRLIGAYSVGADGVDDGGDKIRDTLWDLYGSARGVKAAAQSGGAVQCSERCDRPGPVDALPSATRRSQRAVHGIAELRLARGGSLSRRAGPESRADAHAK